MKSKSGALVTSNPAVFLDGYKAANQEAFVRLLESGFDFEAVREFSVLAEGEWEMLDSRIIAAARKQLVGVQDLIDEGLTHDLGDLGTFVTSWQLASDFDPANVSMSAQEEPEDDTVDIQKKTAPVPIVSKGYRLDLRELLASRRTGQDLDTMNAERAGREVSVTLEGMLFNGSPITLGGDTIYGYTTHPSRNYVAAAAVPGVAAAGDFGTIGNIDLVFRHALELVSGDFYRGPYRAYISRTQWYQMKAFYADGSGQTAETRIRANFPEIKSLKMSDELTDELVLVSMNRDVVDWGVAHDLDNVEWAPNPFVTRIRVFAAQIPRVKADINARSGIVHIDGI